MPEEVSLVIAASGANLAGAFFPIIEAAGSAASQPLADRFVQALALVLVCITIYRGIKTRRKAGSTSATRPGSSPTDRLILPLGTKTLQIGPYKAFSTLGKGGMGTVFKAVDSQGQIVAIKMIGGRGTDRRAKGNEVYRIGLVREARLAAELRHPNIVRIYDIGQEKGNLYVVMEYLEGVPLDRYIQSRKVGVAEALRIGAELCDALGYAHSRGVIHRDVKPQNTFIMANGRVKLVDFGLACPREGVAGFRGAGTPGYMSPEQIIEKDLDGRTDIWSAGVTVFVMLTRRHPFRRYLGGVYSGILRAHMASLKLQTPYTGEIEVILAKALAKDRDARYASANDFAKDLRSMIRKVQGEEIGAQILTKSASEPSAAAGNYMGQTADARRYIPVDLGLREQVKSPVIFPIVREKRGVLHSIGREIPEMLKSMAVGLWWTVFIGGLGFLLLGILIAVGIVFTLVVILPVAIFELALPPAFFRCRSCRRRMRLASTWIRPTWIADKCGFCMPDCLAALEAGLWEEAVKLLAVHTVRDDHERRFKLEFFDCRKCHDQRAYLMVEDRDRGRWVADSVREAYKFGDPLGAQKFVRGSIASNTTGAMTSPRGRDNADDQATL
jgi:serine/threonine protein kinase